MDELSLISTEKLQYEPGKWAGGAWQCILVMWGKDNSPKYTLLVKLVKSLLCLLHGNTDVTKGFSENRQLLQERRKLSNASINELRAAQSFSKMYDCNLAAIPIKIDVKKV